MDLGTLRQAHSIGPLTSGNNFWTKLAPVVQTPGSYILIQNQVNAGGGARGRKLDHFVILNISRDHDRLAQLGAQNLELISSELVQGVQVHESTLKGILALARKGDRKLIKLGRDLVLGQKDLIMQVFPHIFDAQASRQLTQSSSNGTPFSPEEMMEMENIDWSILFTATIATLDDHNGNPFGLTGIPGKSKNFALGAVAVSVQHPQPVYRQEIHTSQFPSFKKKLEKRLSELSSGQYIRIIFIPGKRDLFIGDLTAIYELKRRSLEPSHKEIDLDAAQTNGTSLNGHNDHPLAEDVSNDVIQIKPTEATAPSIDHKNAELSQPSVNHHNLETAPDNDIDHANDPIMWTHLYTKYGTLGKELAATVSNNRFRVINYRSHAHAAPQRLGVIITYDLYKKLGIDIDTTSIETFASADLSARNIDARECLKNNHPIAITKSGKIHTFVFPMGALPPSLRDHINEQKITEDRNISVPRKELTMMPTPHQQPAKQIAGTFDLSTYSDPHMAEYFWTNIRYQSALLKAELDGGCGYGLVEHQSKKIGIVASVKFIHGCDVSQVEKVSYASTEVGKKAQQICENLAEGKAVVITSRNATQFTIYPLSQVPLEIAAKIMGQDLSEISTLPASDVAAETAQNNVPEPHTVAGADIMPSDAGVPQEPPAADQGEMAFPAIITTQPDHDRVAEKLKIIKTPGLDAAFKSAAKVAMAYKSPIILVGEQGVGKAMVAKYIHALSLRNGQPFGAVDLSHFAPSSYEAELFGHGELTGTPGAFEAANGGTVFIHDIGLLPSNLQPSLARLVGGGVVRRTGSHKDIDVDTRVIMATKTPLADMASSGQLSDILQGHLNVPTINIPPLRDRPDDIHTLAQHFLDCASKQERLPIKTLSDEATTMLLRHQWPDNARGLKNAIRRATVLADGDMIKPQDLGFPLA